MSAASLLLSSGCSQVKVRTERVVVCPAPEAYIQVDPPELLDEPTYGDLVQYSIDLWYTIERMNLDRASIQDMCEAERQNNEKEEE